MSKEIPNLVLEIGSAKKLKIAVIVAEFNSKITARLRANTWLRLKDLGAVPANIVFRQVPGSLELPLAAKALAKTKKYSAIICLGCVIRGDTSHFDLVCNESVRGIGQAALDTGVPCIYGVVTCNTEKQAMARSNGGENDVGRYAAEAAVHMAHLLQEI